MSFSFGTAAPAAAPAAGSGGFSFGGAPAAAAPAATTAPAGTGFNFGAPAAAKPTGVAAPLSFGAPAATAAAAATTTAPPAFGGFGTAATAATTTTAAAPLTLGAAAAKPTGLSLPLTGGGFGAPAASTAAPTLGGFGAAAAATKTTTTTTGFGFGAPAAPTTSAAATTGGFGGFGAAATAAATTSAAPAFGLGGTTTTAAGGFGLTSLASSTATTAAAAPAAATSTAAAAPKVGLGGITNPLGAAAGQKPAGADGKGANGGSDPKSLKETQVPAELAAMVEEFKKFVKEERGVSSDIAHISSKMYQKIKADTETLLTQVQSLKAGVAKNKAHLDLLKMDAAQELLNVEIAQRTKDTPPALQYENVAPYEYFARVVTNFENQMLLYRRQIEETEQHLKTMATHNALGPDDITKALDKMHATFTNLAAGFQKLHEMCQQQKELYVHIHRLKYGKNPELSFDEGKTPKALAAGGGFSTRLPAATAGPSPFTGQQDLLARAKASLSARGPQQQQQAPLGAPPTYGLGATPAGAFNVTATAPGQNTSLFGTPAAGQTTGLYGSTMSPFGQAGQQSTTLFGKRGKH